MKVYQLGGSIREAAKKILSFNGRALTPPPSSSLMELNGRRNFGRVKKLFNFFFI